MKKTNIIIGIGVFIIMTFFLCAKQDKYYKKEVRFESEKEVLEQLESFPTVVRYEENGYYREEFTNEFLECLSKRKRYTYPMVDVVSFDTVKERSLDENEKKVIRDDYINRLENFFNYKINENMIISSYEIEYTYNPYEETKEKGIMNIILIDEGEGYVIDYLTISNEGGEKDVEGF